ncbi:MAG: hypothetical protein HZB16_21855 [Armatimonadetes bacterium]|nr:hypothetical protein [Armatimonadota bacterium]
MIGLALAFTAALSLTATTNDQVGWFPETVAGASRVEAPRVWDRETIFDYMDGKGEPYLTYSLRQVTTCTYKIGAHSADVMIFDMQTPAEAFGIWSTIIEDEAPDVLQSAGYNSGVFRGWVGPIFLDIAGEVDTPEVKTFALAFAKDLAARVKPGDKYPPLAAALPVEPLTLTKLRFFHAEMSLAGIYYVSTQNVFGLDAETDCMFADAVIDAKPAKVMVVEYDKPEQRERGWTAFTKKILSDKATAGDGGTLCEDMGEGLWWGIARVDGPEGKPRLAAVYDAASLAACQKGLAELVKSAGVR